ncbi:MAG TPA: hypothetical protein VKS01_06790 [Bryobacteraceae bacterium]|nr:hypothetical protein [Bryobacteraceae bacterium]
MATLYVENVPDERYEALKKKAARNKRSISAEIMDLIEHFYPTEEELKKRFSAVESIIELASEEPLTPGPFPSGVEMLREDRDR